MEDLATLAGTAARRAAARALRQVDSSSGSSQNPSESHSVSGNGGEKCRQPEVLLRWQPLAAVLLHPAAQCSTCAERLGHPCTSCWLVA